MRMKRDSSSKYIRLNLLLKFNSLIELLVFSSIIILLKWEEVESIVYILRLQLQ